MNLFTTLESAAGVEKDLASWGISRCNREHNNQAADSFGFDLQAQIDAPDLFPYGAKIIIRRQRQAQLAPGQLAPAPNSFVAGSGAIFFVGYRKQHIRHGSGRIEGFKYKFGGMWDQFFELHEYQQPWYWLLNKGGKVTIEGQFYSTQIVLGQSPKLLILPNGVQTTQETMAQAMIDAANWTLGVVTKQYGSAQFQIDSALPTSNFDGVGGWEGYFPMQAANDITTAEAIKKILQLVPQSSAWFDCSTTASTGGPGNADGDPLPTFRVNTRNMAPSVTLPLSMGMGVKPEIERRDDLTPPCIDYKFRIRSTLNGNTSETLVDDLACDFGQTNVATGITDPNLLQYSTYIGAVLGTFDFSGPDTTDFSLNVQSIPLDNSDSSKMNWTHVLATSLSNVSITNVDWSKDASGNPFPPTLTDPHGVIDTTRYKYYLVGGPCPTGFIDPLNPGVPQGVQLRLAAMFDFTETANDDLGHPQVVGIKSQVVTIDLYCYSMPSGNYVTGIVAGEAIPFGLAKFVYDIESQPQYQGSWTVTEQDITDVCPMGTSLNISGGLKEWETMNAQIQQITYDLIAGTTTLTFGPAKHLGGDDYIQRIRLNRGPRWLWLIGNNVSGGVNPNTAVSGPTQLKDTQAAAAMNSYLWMSANPSSLVKDSAGNPVGVIHDVTPFVSGKTPVGGQVILNTGDALPAGVPAGTLKLTTVQQAGSLVMSVWSSSPNSPPLGTDFISVTVQDLITILAGIGGVGDPSIKLRALQTCETAPTGKVIFRIFACSPPITVSSNWVPPQ